ncbi:hypothetical protein ACJIZ3_010897 [Penstemon smallii]|uniref:C3H1-type domain-containing protein n=1 Tax=Penstemon smallii TaxID=265156 RepID=A0ABD3UJ37_9LAMI
MQRNGGISNTSSNSAADKVEEVMRRLKIERGDENGTRLGDELGSGLYPERPGEPDCLYYLRTGICGYGINCRFNHPSNAGGQVYGVKNSIELPERDGQPDCGFFLKTGTCKYGSTCKYHHPKDRKPESPVLLNNMGLPIRQDAKPCLYYMRTGLCKYGYVCKFNHPQLTTAPNVLPVYASAVVPPSSVGEFSTAALSNTSYFPSSVVQLPQSYMPVMLSQPQGWNTYMGNLSPLPVTSVLTAPASTGQLSVGSYLPERPDQPECRHFMIHGSCKYGSDCKYHHPRERISQLASSSLGPLGLPLRPGLPICSDYSFYGICKYGPTCRYDHPLDGYSYAYGLGVPPLATSYLHSTTYHSIPSFSETSPSKMLSDKNRHLNPKSIGDSPDQYDSLPCSPKQASEVAHDESD